MGEFKQYIIVNKGLNMSSGKLAAQVSHASMAFLTKPLLLGGSDVRSENGEAECVIKLPLDVYTNWVCGSFKKVILEVKNETQMQKVYDRLKSEGFKEDVDFFKIVDIGTTEFNGIPHWTAIGLIPLDTERIDIKAVTKRLQVYKD